MKGSPEASELLASLRALTPSQLQSHIHAIKCEMGHRFDFEVEAAVLSRATDEELLALHRPRRVRR